MLWTITFFVGTITFFYLWWMQKTDVESQIAAVEAKREEAARARTASDRKLAELIKTQGSMKKEVEDAKVLSKGPTIQESREFRGHAVAGTTPLLHPNRAPPIAAPAPAAKSQRWEDCFFVQLFPDYRPLGHRMPSPRSSRPSTVPRSLLSSRSPISPRRWAMPRRRRPPPRRMWRHSPPL
mmetsp:Transcript_69365/g.219496  ORF Transcript_69365/g.219496 Transcript_69365/m.219496 type:complete len:181 (+) Transcript_69365:500-1042(+)